MRSSSSQGSSSSDQSRKSELGGLVDLLTVDNDLTSLQGVFTSWLHDVGTDKEHLHLILPDSQNDGLRVLQCDIHERLLNPAQLPFLSQFSLTLDSQVANVRPTPPPSSKMAVCGVTGGTTVPVHSLRVIRRLPSAAICESVLYGMPLLVDATSCWKTDWDELETNRHDFQALVKLLRHKALVQLLRHKNEVLLACLETTPSETVPKSRFVYNVPTPKPCGHFLLLPSHQPCHLLLKAVAVNEIILPQHFSSADEPSEETVSVMDACLSQVAVESSYNPLLFSSGLCESLVTQLSTKGRPLTIAGKRKPQTSGGGNASSVGRSAIGWPTHQLSSGSKNARHKTGRDIYGKPMESFPTEL